MQPSIKMPSVGSVAAKLKEARLAAGLSTHSAAALVKKRFPGLSLSHSSIANYEKSASAPGVDIISALAMIYDRPINWFFEAGMPLTGIRYRLLTSKTPIKERHQFESQSQYWLEAYIRLENRVGEPLRPRLQRPKIVADTTGRELAAIVRKKLGLGDEPIPSVIEVLEAFGIRTLEMPTDLAIDGFAARLGEEPIVILKPTAANDRCRLNAGHELGHVLFGDCDSGQETTKEMDNRAFEFGSYLLITPEKLKEAFVGRSAVKLVQYKEQFGISMAGMIYRAEKQGIIDAKLTKQLWIQFSRRGWRANEPGTVRADRAIRFERLLDQAISERKITWTEAAAITGVKATELRRRRDLAMGITDGVPEEEEKGASILRFEGQ